MEEVFDVYYCSVCHVCKKPSESPETMKFCSGCKLVQYCSVEHQKQDWPNHKELCKSVQRIMKRTNMGHLYQEAVNFEPGDLTSWNKLRVSCVKLVESAQKRDLSSEETQMILFPPVCTYCHLYKVNNMFICQLCKSVMYCSKDHQYDDQKHVSVCKYLNHSFEVDMLRFREQSSMFNFLEFVHQSRRVSQFPESMEAFVKSLTSTLTTKGICLSELLSYTFTLIFAISKIAEIRSNQLTLHIVGADSMEFLAMQTFPLICHLLPHIVHLNIVLIGPRVLEEDSIPLCIEDSNCISLCSVNSLYHEYVDSPKFVSPDMIAVFNCGFCEFVGDPAKDTWGKSLSSMLSFRNKVVITTSYTERESTVDLQRLCVFKHKDLECNVIMNCKENPFGSLYPHRDWENEGVYYGNKFISVLRT